MTKYPLDYTYDKWKSINRSKEMELLNAFLAIAGSIGFIMIGAYLTYQTLDTLFPLRTVRVRK
jgi:hypothetical protein